MQRCPYIHEMRERFFTEQPKPISYLPQQPTELTKSTQRPQPLSAQPVQQQKQSPQQLPHTQATITMPIRGGIDRESEREGLIDVRQSSALSGASSNQVGTVVKVGAILASTTTKKKSPRFQTDMSN